MQERRLGSRYVLTDPLGRGAMGQVFRARVVNGTADEAGAEVAVKVLRDDLAAEPDLIHRFLQEGRLLKSVDHPNVVRIRDLVAEGDRLALVMDLVDGGDLRRAVTVPCPERTAARIAAGIASGLAAVHAAGITHRDVKPENVLVERGPDGTGRARLADFGVSRFEAATTTRTKGMTGTVGYIAPEIARGEPATAAGDVYALGVILYELCVGHGPFAAEHPIALIRAHAEDPVPRPADMSPPLWELVESLLAKDPADRPTASDAADRLTDLSDAPADGELGGTGELGDDAEVPAGWFRLPVPVDTPIVQAASVEAASVVDSAGTAPATIHEVAPEELPVDDVVTLPVAVAVAAPVAAPVTAPVPVAATALDPTSAAAPVPVPTPAAPVPVGFDRSVPPPPPPFRPALAPADPHRRRRTVTGLVAAAALLAVGGATWAASTTTLRTDHTVALGNGTGAGDRGGPVLVPGTTAAVEPAANVAKPAAKPVPTSSSRALSVASGPAPAEAPPREVRTRTVTATATAPVVVVAPPQRHEPVVHTTTRTATATVTSTAAAPAPVAPPAPPKPAPPKADPIPAAVSLFRYWNAAIGDHFYTTDYAELGAGRSGYVLEGVQAKVLPTAAPGAVPLHRYWNATTGDHFYTTNYAELGGGTSGYVYERVQAYVYAAPAVGLQAIHRYWNPTTGDHFYTTNFAELGAGGGGYRYEGVAGYSR